LEEDVRDTFPQTTAAVLEFVANGSLRGDMIKLMRRFVSVHDAAEQESIDPKGIAIRTSAIEPQDDPSADQDRDQYDLARRLEDGGCAPIAQSSHGQQ